jgi:hypothetical protein
LYYLRFAVSVSLASLTGFIQGEATAPNRWLDRNLFFGDGGGEDKQNPRRQTV